MKPVTIKPKDNLNDIVESFYGHLRRFEGINIGERAKLSDFIAPILPYLGILFDDGAQGIKPLVGKSMPGQNINANGQFEFIIERGNKKICIVEAKKDKIDQGIAQDLLGCEAVADPESMGCVYGIVTNYLYWVFLRSLDDRIEKDVATLAIAEGDSIATKEGLKLILGKIYALLSE